MLFGGRRLDLDRTSATSAEEQKAPKNETNLCWFSCAVGALGEIFGRGFGRFLIGFGEQKLSTFDM